MVQPLREWRGMKPQQREKKFIWYNHAVPHLKIQYLIREMELNKARRKNYIAHTINN